MVLTSDINVDISRFDPASVTPQQEELNAFLTEQTAATPPWYTVGAPAFRQMRSEGKTPFPKPVLLPGGHDITVPSREQGRDIPCRVFLPSDGASPQGILMHMHGGGWTMHSARDFDFLLRSLSDGCGSDIRLAVVSIDYRRAPENPFPAAQEDCLDAARWLAVSRPDHALLAGLPLSYMAGESAGGHLAVITTLSLLAQPGGPPCQLKGLLLQFGAYSLQSLPHSVYYPGRLMLTPDSMAAYIDAVTPAQHKGDPSYLLRPDVSPLYANLEQFRGRLPPALFICGTADLLLEDSLFMGLRWQTAGGQPQTFIKIMPGQPHAFISLPVDKDPAVPEAQGYCGDFLTLNSKAAQN